jgi:hypothetical protein
MVVIRNSNLRTYFKINGNEWKPTQISVRCYYLCLKTRVYAWSIVCTCLVIVCLFVSRRLDDNKIKEDGSQSQPSNGDGDYSTQDEDEDYFDIVKPGKPSFESYPNT